MPLSPIEIDASDNKAAVQFPPPLLPDPLATLRGSKISHVLMPCFETSVPRPAHPRPRGPSYSSVRALHSLQPSRGPQITPTSPRLPLDANHTLAHPERGRLLLMLPYAAQGEAAPRLAPPSSHVCYHTTLSIRSCSRSPSETMANVASRTHLSGSARTQATTLQPDTIAAWRPDQSLLPPMQHGIARPSRRTPNATHNTL